MFFNKALDKINVSQEWFDYTKVEFSKEKNHFCLPISCSCLRLQLFFTPLFLQSKQAVSGQLHTFVCQGQGNMGMTDTMTIRVLIKQQSVLIAFITFIRKCFYSKGGGLFFTEIYFSNSSYNTLQSSFVIGL